MKKILTLLLAAQLCGGLSFAQSTLPHADISVQLTKPSADTTIAYGDSLSVSFNYTNNGPDMLSAGDTLFFDISGLLIYSVILQPMQPNMTFVYNDVAYFYNPTDSALSVDLCVAIVPQEYIQYNNGGVAVTTYIDEDSTNDVDCRHVILQGPDTSTNGIHGIAASEINELQVYPNPVIEHLTFELPVSVPNASIKMVITDVTGRKVIQQSTKAAADQHYHLNVATLPAGVYFLNASAENRSWRTKFVKK